MAPPVNGTNVLGTRMMRQNTNQRKQAMSDIEASVTKLLIATKQLLESLTQWSRQEATENDVSDIYVNLGNEFNRATISFQNAGIDMSDLENTPNELRHILERALGEDASVANLDKFLPRIREIIINLLQGLKRKQQIHRIQNGEAAAPPRLRRVDSPGPSLSSSTSKSDMSRQRSASPSVTSAMTPAAEGTNGHASTNYSPAKRQLPSIPAHQTSPSQILPPRKAPEPPVISQKLFAPAPAIPSNSDPVTQLSQMTLERRSSKRFSENYLAQLTSSPNSDRSGKLSVNDVRKHLQKSVAIPETVEDEEPESMEYSASRAYGSPPLSKSFIPKNVATSPVAAPAPVFRTIEAPRPRTPVIGQDAATQQSNGHAKSASLERLDIFLKKSDATKKITLEQPPSLEALREATEKAFGPLESEVLYIEDAATRIAYELQDVSDVRQGSIILLRSPKSATMPNEEVAPQENSNTELKSWLDQRLEQLTQAISEVKASSITTRAAAPAQEHDTAQHSLTTRDDDGKLAALQLENENLKLQLAQAQTALREKEMPESAPIVVSANRDHVMSMSAKHEHRGTELTAKLEEAMNTMERIRKDVLQRKVTPRPQQLADLSTEFDAIKRESEALAQNLVVLDTVSNKLWEEELTIITSEQDALEYQRAFIDDIRADLEQSLSSLSTIKQVEEQKRVATVTSVPMILETSTDPSRAIKFVQADIKSLQINHERRAEAIADAEKQRIKEREYLMENEFKKELGAFVGSNNLKDTGGAAEIDRLREEKDNALRKMIFTKTGPEERQSVIDLEDSKLPKSALTEDSSIASPPEVSMPQAGQMEVPTEAETASQPKALSGTASILARIDASKGVDALDRRRSSLMKHAPSNESMASRGKPSETEDAIKEDVPAVESRAVQDADREEQTDESEP